MKYTIIIKDYKKKSKNLFFLTGEEKIIQGKIEEMKTAIGWKKYDKVTTKRWEPTEDAEDTIIQIERI